MEAPHAVDWLALGVTVTTFPIVLGRITTCALPLGAVPVSRAVSVTVVSAPTVEGTTVNEFVPVSGADETGNTTWSLEVIT